MNLLAFIINPQDMCCRRVFQWSIPILCKGLSPLEVLTSKISKVSLDLCFASRKLFQGYRTKALSPLLDGTDLSIGLLGSNLKLSSTYC